ncbi:MAG: ATP-dependent helicase UvrD/PcrA [Clostridium butyricum]|nr:ATP-dependent helicase UvrD/PcrA [Clostridium butyricum]
MQLKNKVIISAAGSGKTTYIVKDALAKNKEKIIILTYTIYNLGEIKKNIIEKCGVIPVNIKIQTWFSFLLNECVRPYQNFLFDKNRIDTIKYPKGKSTLYIPKKDINKYFFYKEKDIYSDKISEFVCLCNEKSKGLVIQRLEKLYDYIYIDEVQDLAGHDFDLIELFMNSKISTVFVGDNRQATFSTNNSSKYKNFKGKNILNLFKKWEKEKKCHIEYRTECFRCNKYICEFANLLYPDMPKTISRNTCITGHDGIFFIKESQVTKYIEEYNPQILRYDKKTKFNSERLILNFGAAKGMTFDRVLILPNSAIKNFLKTGDTKYIEKSKAKLYVALTRAKYSVTFVFDDKVGIDCIKSAY